MNGHMKAVIATILALLGMSAGPLAVYDTLSKDNTATKTKIETLEKRQAEDRADVKDKVREIDVKVQRVDDNVQTILRKLDVMEDRRNAEARRR